MKIYFLLIKIILLFSQEIINTELSIRSFKNRIVLIGDSEYYKNKLSRRIFRLTEKYSTSISKCIPINEEENRGICIDTGSWMGNEIENVAIFNIINSKIENNKKQTLQILKKNIVYVNAIFVVFDKMQISNNLMNILSTFDEMYGNGFWKHVLFVSASNTLSKCVQSKKIFEDIRKEFLVEKVGDIVCLDPLHSFSDKYENVFFKVGSYKTWKFVFNQSVLNLSYILDDVDIKLTKVLRLQSFLEKICI